MYATFNAIPSKKHACKPSKRAFEVDFQPGGKKGPKAFDLKAQPAAKWKSYVLSVTLLHTTRTIHGIHNPVHSLFEFMHCVLHAQLMIR